VSAFVLHYAFVTSQYHRHSTEIPQINFRVLNIWAVKKVAHFWPTVYIYSCGRHWRRQQLQTVWASL